MRRRVAALFWRKHHDHLAAFDRWLDFYLGDVGDFQFYPFEEPDSQILVCHFAAPEAQGDFHLVSLLEKPPDGLHLDAIIVIVNSRAQLDFLNFDDLLLLSRLRGFFLLKKAEFAVIQYLADRGARRGNDFDEIKSCVLGCLLGLVNVDDAAIVAVGVDQLYFADTDVMVNTQPVLLRHGRSFQRASNGKTSFCW
jgi:hypothetical protein